MTYSRYVSCQSNDVVTSVIYTLSVICEKRLTESISVLCFISTICKTLRQTKCFKVVCCAILKGSLNIQKKSRSKSFKGIFNAFMIVLCVLCTPQGQVLLEMIIYFLFVFFLLVEIYLCLFMKKALRVRKWTKCYDLFTNPFV